MFNYLKESFKRKIARRITREYPVRIDTFNIQNIGEVQFINWQNPLITSIKLDEQKIAFFKQFVAEGDLAIDIGAHTGDITVPLGLCTGPGGLTIGFDPNPYVYKILEQNAALNVGKVNIVAVPCAISVNEEEFYFISSEASFGNGGISATKDSKHGKYVYPHKIKGINLKRFLEEQYREWLSKFSFIKIDTEGYDKEIIKSVSGLISQYKPVIIAESFGKSADEAKMELYDVLDQLDYEIFYFEDFNINTHVEKMNTRTDILKWKQTIDIYALPKK